LKKSELKPPSTSLPEPVSDFEARFKLYEVFRGYIKHEDGLIDNRVTWLSQIHGFLYATYGFTLQKKIEIMQQVSSHVDESTSTFMYMSKSHLGSSILELDAFMLFIAVIGIALSYSSGKSIEAATTSINSIAALFYAQGNIIPYAPIKTASYNTMEIPETFPIQHGPSQLFLPMIVGGGHSKAHVVGFHAPIRIPTILMWGWYISILYFVVDISLSRGYLFHDFIEPIHGSYIYQLLVRIGVN
jgi:hypothetical protein